MESLKPKEQPIGTFTGGPTTLRFEAILPHTPQTAAALIQMFGPVLLCADVPSPASSWLHGAHVLARAANHAPYLPAANQSPA